MGIGPAARRRGSAGLVAALTIYITLVAGRRAGAVHGHRRLGAAPVARLRPVLRVRRRCCSRSRPSCRRSTSRAGRSSTRPSRSRPFSYILALEGVDVAVAWVAGRRPAVGCGAGDAGSSPARSSAFAVVVRASPGRSCVHGGLGGRRDRVEAVAADPRPAPAPAPRTGSCRSTRPRRSTGPDRGGVVLVNDPIETIQRGRARLRHRAGSSSTSDDIRRRPRPDPRRRPAGLGRPAARAPAIAGLVPSIPLELGVVTRREAVLTGAAGCSLVALVVRAVVAARSSSSRSPRTRPTTSASPATSSRAAGWSPTRCGAIATPPLVFPRPAFEVWLPLPTFLAAIPMAIFGHHVPGGPGLVRRHRARWCRCWPGASRADVAAERGLAPGRARTLAIGVGPDGRGLPAAPAPLRPARLDDAVRGPRPGRLPADDADRARPARRRLTDPRLIGLGHPDRPRRADPQRDGVAGPHLGRDRLVRDRRAAGRAAAPDRRRRGRRARRLRAVGGPQHGSSSGARCRARRRPTRST